MWTSCRIDWLQPVFYFWLSHATPTDLTTQPLGPTTAVWSKSVVVWFSCWFFPPVATGSWNTNFMTVDNGSNAGYIKLMTIISCNYIFYTLDH